MKTSLIVGFLSIFILSFFCVNTRMLVDEIEYSNSYEPNRLLRATFSTPYNSSKEKARLPVSLRLKNTQRYCLSIESSQTLERNVSNSTYNLFKSSNKHRQSNDKVVSIIDNEKERERERDKGGDGQLCFFNLIFI